MTIDDVVRYYVNSYQFNKRTKMSINNIRNWKKLGHVPISSQMKLEKLSNGVLKASLEHATND